MKSIEEIKQEMELYKQEVVELKAKKDMLIKELKKVAGTTNVERARKIAKEIEESVSKLQEQFKGMMDELEEGLNEFSRD